MRTPGRRSKPFALGVTFIGLSLMTVYSYAQMRSTTDGVRRADAELKTCHRLVSEIINLQVRPGFAAVEQEPPSAMANRVQQAVRLARLPTGAVVRVAPQPTTRLGNTSYQVAATTLELRNVTLEQVTTFSQHLIDEDHGLTVRDLRLYASGVPNSGPETWSADLTLTQLIFSPTTR